MLFRIVNAFTLHDNSRFLGYHQTHAFCQPDRIISIHVSEIRFALAECGEELSHWD